MKCWNRYIQQKNHSGICLQNVKLLYDEIKYYIFWNNDPYFDICPPPISSFDLWGLTLLGISPVRPFYILPDLTKPKLKTGQDKGRKSRRSYIDQDRFLFKSLIFWNLYPFQVPLNSQLVLDHEKYIIFFGAFKVVLKGRGGER